MTLVPPVGVDPTTDLGWHQAADFIADLRWQQVPRDVRNRAALVVADLVASTVPGREAPTSKIAAEVAADVFGGDRALAWYDGSPLSVPGAAFANAVMANSLDFDDGHRLTKGHPGAVIIPAAVAIAQQTGASVTDLMAAIIVGYEIGIRTGIGQHSRRPQYHATGSWGAVGAAAASAYLLQLDREQIRHALGLAEYHGPISLIMRSVDDPQMTKDGIGWGAQVGVTSALLAQRGFTAVHPELLNEDDFGSLGSRWSIEEVYVKPFPCCRWAQSAITAAQVVSGQVSDPADIVGVEISTFEAAAALSRRRPTTTEEAQYNLIWPVAAALAHGRYTVADVLTGFDSTEVHAMADKVQVTVLPELTAEFPDLRRAEVTLTMRDGSKLRSGLLEADGEPGSEHWQRVVADKVAQYLGKQLVAGDVDPPVGPIPTNDHQALLDVLCYAAT